MYLEAKWNLRLPRRCYRSSRDWPAPFPCSCTAREWQLSSSDRRGRFAVAARSRSASSCLQSRATRLRKSPAMLKRRGFSVRAEGRDTVAPARSCTRRISANSRRTTLSRCHLLGRVILWPRYEPESSLLIFLRLGKSPFRSVRDQRAKPISIRSRSRPPPRSSASTSVETQIPRTRRFHRSGAGFR